MENPHALQHPVNLLCFLVSTSHSHIMFHSPLRSREALSNLFWNQIQEKNSYLCRIASETVFCVHLTWRTLLLLLKASDTALLHEVGSHWERHSPKFQQSTIRENEINFSFLSLM